MGEIEVRGSEGNGIDGFDGHRQSGLGPNPGDPGYGQYGFVNVQDFSGQNDPSDNYFHGTFVAGIMASEYTSVSDGVNTAPFLGVAPLATYYGAVFDGSGDKAGFLSLNNSLNYVLETQGATVANNSWGSEVTDASQLDGNSATSLLMDEYAGYAGKTGGTTGHYADKLLVISAGYDGATTGLIGQPAFCFNTGSPLARSMRRMIARRGYSIPAGCRQIAWPPTAPGRRWPMGARAWMWWRRGRTSGQRWRSI